MRRALACELIPDLPQSSVLVVVSSDCDVASRDFDKEPLVEVVELREVDRLDGNLTNGKNPRRLHLSIGSDNGELRHYEAAIDDRQRFDRRIVSQSTPSDTVSLDSHTVVALKLWVAKRYNRAAFPDAFNKRIVPVVSAVKEELRSIGAYIDSIWFGLETLDELPSDVPYHVQFFFVMKVEDYRIRERREEGQAAFDRVLALIHSCSGIEVENEGLLPENELTLDDLRALRRWDWDDLTIRVPESDPPLPGTEL